ncbi:MAG: AbrB/MazE/SpoVT family DNA-binding domain-containing protein [Desulfohalobiaceae bacterium]
MKPESVTVSKRGYIVLPAHIRKEMNIKPGSKILIHQEEGRLTLEAVPSFTQCQLKIKEPVPYCLLILHIGIWSQRPNEHED